MGAFDDVESRSPTRYTNMLGRGVGEARRRMVLIALLAFFLILTLVGFRRQDTIKDVVNSSLHHNNSTAPAVVAKPDTKADTKTATKADTKTDIKSDKIDSSSKSRLQSDPPTQLKGPKLDNGDRTLAPQSLTDLHNSSLGVRTVEAM
jgi:hypothetical protein